MDELKELLEEHVENLEMIDVISNESFKYLYKSLVVALIGIQEGGDK